MTDLPPALRDYLRHLTVDQWSAAFLRVDREGRLVDSGGSLGLYGLDGVGKGESLAGRVDFFKGMLPVGDEPIVLPRMELAPGRFADVHLVGGEEADWVLFLDVSETAEVHQLLQQRGNELSLLRHELERNNRQLQAEKEKSERLLLSIFPKPIVEQLKTESGIIARSFEAVSILFADIFDFSRLTSERSPIDVVRLLRDVFSLFDGLADRHGLEKIKTIGDGYMAVGGAPVTRADHAECAAEAALAMQQEIVRFDAGIGRPLQLRIGIHSGPVVAGVIGTARLAYDLWGDTVNSAAQMETFGLPGAIQVSETTAALLEERYHLDLRGEFYVKGQGAVRTWLLTGRRRTP